VVVNMEELREMIPKTPDMFAGLIGKGCGFRWMDYTWRDVALYALAVGANKNDLPYIYERVQGDMKALPTFCVLPYINSILIKPPTKVPYGPNEILIDFIVAGLGGKFPNRIHMAQEIIIHHAIDAMKGTFMTEDKVEAVYDWGDKGVVGVMSQEVMDIAGNPVCTIKGTHWHKAFGNFGGEKFISPKVEYPNKDPDYEVSEFLADNQAVLYRMLGDTYHVHIDPEVSGKRGYDMPFMQGLGTIGFAVRMAIQKIIPYQPERVTRVYAQMRKVCYPGQNVRFVGWEIDKGIINFKLLADNGDSLLDNCVFEYK
jgi:acyl dehydratase